MRIAKNKRIHKRPLIMAGLAIVITFVGGVFAVNYTSNTFENSFMLGEHIATHIETFESPENWNVCEEIPKTLVTRNDSTHNIRVRISYDEYWRMQNDETELPLTKDGIRLAVINFQNVDDWEDGHDGWYYFKEALEPGESTTSYFKSVTLDCSASFGGENVCTETETGTVCQKQENPYEGAKYHLNIIVQTTSEDFDDNNLCHVIINPNGGLFNGSSENYDVNTRCGGDIDLRDISYEEHELLGWTKNGSEAFSGTEIRIDDDIELVANWRSTIRYNVTVDPNGGSYDGSTLPSYYEARKEETFVLDRAAVRDGYFVDYWQVVGNGRLEGDRFVVMSDIALQAHWDKAVARIERTQKIYNSIMAAHAAAEPGDIITLLVDTAEIVTNEKNVTLDLNGHTVTGTLNNTTSGNITLINGEINNPDGAAVTNDGTLTMGINDYDDDGVANVISNNIRLIGTTVGLKQTNETYRFYFYDGFIEGDIGLQGGYDGAPFYRRAYDDVMVYFFPLVDRMEEGDRIYQHVELANADRAVTKTSVRGDIYYYNMQDNINVSALTGYKIYAVRDFDASYPITVANGDTIDFDVAGYNVDFSETMTNNGVFNIENSSDTGRISAWRTMVNNNELSLANVKISAASANTLINNRKNIHMTNSTLTSAYGTTMVVESGMTTILDLDDDSLISSTSSSPAISNNSTLTISGGRILGGKVTIGNSYTGTINVTGGIVESTNSTSSDSATIYSQSNYNNVGTVNITGGQVIATGNARYAIYGGNVYINGGTVRAEGPNANTGVSYPQSFTMKSGSLIVRNTSDRGYANGMNYSNSIRIEGGTIDVSGYSATAITTYYDYQNQAQIIAGQITARSTGGVAYGVSGIVSMSGGSISATSSSNTGCGIYISTNNRTINLSGGKVYGSTYGVSGNTSMNVTLGTNNDSLNIVNPEVEGGSYAIYNTNIYFYDGILKGGVNAYTSGSVKAVMDATELHVERIDSVENVWLVESANYLEVNGVEYNSLKKAYNAVSDGGTVKVIADFSTSAVMPTNPSGKTITFDINGHRLTYTQSLVNSGTMNFIDSSDEQNGVLANTNSAVIANSAGTLNVISGKILGYQVAIGNINSNSSRNTVNISGGVVEVTHASGSSGGAVTSNYSDNTTVNLTGGQIVASGDSSEALYNLGSLVIDGGTIIVNSSNYANATFSVQRIHMKSGLVKVQAGNGGANGFNYFTSATMEGGRLEVKATSGNNSASGFDGWSSYCMNMTGGEVVVESVGGTTRGIATCMSMSGGSVSAISTNGTGYGIYIDGNRQATVTGGTVYGSTYGVYGSSTSSNVTIGTNNDTLSTTNPTIQGGLYSVYNSNIYFYDGVLKGTTKAYQDGKIIAIPDATNYHSERIDGVDNCWLIESTAYLEVDGVRYNSLKKAYNAVANGGTVKVVEDFTTSATAPTNPSGKTIYFDINGHSLNYTQPLPNNGTMNFIDSSAEQNGVLANSSTPVISNDSGGTFNMLSGKILGYTVGIRGTGANTINIKGGVVEATHTSSSDSGVIYQNGSNDNSTVNVTGGTVLASGDSTVAIHNTHNLTIDGGNIITNSTSYAGATFSVLNIRFKSGLVKVTSSTSSANGFNYFTSAVMEGGRLEVTSTTSNNGYADGFCGWSSYNTYIYGGEIIVHSNTGTARGIITNLTMTNGTIEATSGSGVGYGVHLEGGRTANISGGSIYGSTNGINGEQSSNVNLGSNDSNINITNPSIRGGAYAIYNSNTYFYDGILRGGTAAYNNNIVKGIAADTYMYINREDYDGVNYDTRYLVAEHDVAQIGSTKYTSLKNAIAAANAGDTIELLEDNYIFNALTIPSGKDFIVDLAGHNIITGNPITNNGKIKIINSDTSTNPLIRYYDGTFITNNAGATFELVGLRINSSSIAENKANATLILDGVELIWSNSVVINNSGNLVVKNSTLNSTSSNTISHNGQSLLIEDSIIRNSSIYYNSAVYISSGTAMINNTDISLDSYSIDDKAALYQYASSGTTLNNTTVTDIINNSGVLNINGGSVTTVGEYAPQAIIANAGSTINLNNTTISAISTQVSYGDSYPARSAISNAGVLNIDSSIIKYVFNNYTSVVSRNITNTGTTTMRGDTQIISDASAATTDSSFGAGIYNSGNLIVESGQITSNRKHSQGIYSAGGTTTIEDIDINLAGVEVYGLYVAGGTVTMGEAEPSDSPDYGKATAHVSTTAPAIRAIGTSIGIGIKKTQGAFNYYDGIATGSTDAEPEPPTNVEYLYEPITHTDADGYKYCILEFMR